MQKEQIISEEKEIQVQGGSIVSWHFSTEKSTSNVPIIFLHGGPGWSSFQLKWTYQPLATESPLIFYDQIGGGRSKDTLTETQNLQSLWTIDHFVNELISIIKQHKCQKFILYGHSWGASLALQYYFRSISDSQLIPPEALILVGPLVSTKLWLQDANYLKEQLPQEQYRILLKHEQQETTQSSEYSKIMNLFYQRHILNNKYVNDQKQNLAVSLACKLSNKQAYLHMWGPNQFHATGTLKDYDRFYDLEKINIPVLLAGGQFDAARPETLVKMANQIKNAEMYTFKQCTHSCTFQKPQQARKKILDFYQKLFPNKK